MSRNVVNFPKPYRSPPDEAGEIVGYGDPPVRRSPLRNAARGAVRGFAYLLFLILLWIRTPIQFVLRLLVAAGMLTGILLWLGGGYPKLMAIGFGLSFGAFFLSFCYDQILYSLSPVPLFLN